MRIVQSPEFSEFEWNDKKADRNRLKHGITFDDAAEAMVRPHLEYRGRHSEELRVLAICPHSGRIIRCHLHRPRRKMPDHFGEAGKGL